MHYKLLFPKKYLHALDLRGKDVTLTIREIVPVEELRGMKGETRRCPIVYFEETAAKAKRENTEEKRLVLIVTVATTIAGMYGTEISEWVGKRITLFPEPNSKSPHGFAIRCRPVLPPPKPDPNSAATGSQDRPNPAADFDIDNADPDEGEGSDGVVC